MQSFFVKLLSALNVLFNGFLSFIYFYLRGVIVVSAVCTVFVGKNMFTCLHVEHLKILF